MNCYMFVFQTNKNACGGDNVTCCMILLPVEGPPEVIFYLQMTKNVPARKTNLFIQESFCWSRMTYGDCAARRKTKRGGRFGSERLFRPCGL